MLTAARKSTLAVSHAPPIPFERSEPKKMSKTSYISFKLKASPEEEKSSEYDFVMKYFRAGNAEELLLWIKDIEKVFIGTATTKGPPRYALARRVLQGDALSAFDRAAISTGNETVENLKTVFNELKKHVFPLNAYQRQRHFLNRSLKKPKEQPIREFMTRLTELNEYLGSFPDPSPQVKAKKFDDHEIADIAANAIPNSWRKTMAMHDFDPLIHTPTEFTLFCERIQFAKGISPHMDKVSNTEPSAGPVGGQSRAKRGDKNRKTTKRKASTEKWCVFHETDSHDTGDCKVVLVQAKKMRGTFEASSGQTSYSRPKNTSNESGASKSVSWKKRTNENFSTELKALITKIIENKMSPESKNSSPESDNDDDNDGEMYNLDKVDEFLNTKGTKNKPVDLVDDMDVEVTEEAKKIAKWIGLKNWSGK